MLMIIDYIGCVMHLPTIYKIVTDQRHERLRYCCCSKVGKLHCCLYSKLPTVNTACMWVVFVTKPCYMLCPD